MAKNAAKPYLLRASLCSPMAHIYGGDRKGLPVDSSKKEATRFPSTGGGAVSCFSSGVAALRRRQEAQGLGGAVRVRRREGRSGAGKKETPPLPYL